MAVRGFKLINEKGQEYSLMDIENYCLMTEPQGLGVSYLSEYEKLGNTFVETFRSIQQEPVTGIANFTSYDNFHEFVNFIVASEKLKLSYKIPFKNGIREFFKNVKLNLLSKTEKNVFGILSETVTFDTLSLWYEEARTEYTIQSNEDDLRWDFVFPSRFVDYNSSSLTYINKGHVDAPIELEIDGNILNPVIELYVEGELYQTVNINTQITEYQKLLYSSKENEFKISKILEDGTEQDLFDLDIINFSNDNVIRIPPSKSCEIKISADTDIRNARLSIYSYYIAV